MNIKKLISAVAASAMLITSTVPFAVSAGADTTLQPLKEIYAETELNGYTDEMLKNVPLSVILDSMTYSNDVYEDIPVEETSSESSECSAQSSENENPAAESDPAEEPTATADTSAANENGAEDPAANSVINTAGNTAEPENIPEETEPAAQAATKRVLVHSAGDKVEFADDAKYVWVGNQEYSIYDKTAAINLFAPNNKGDYSLDKDIIVGKAKQLSTTDIIYHVTINVNHLAFSLDDVSFYYLKNGKETPINFRTNGSSLYETEDYFYFRTGDEVREEDIYFKATPSIAEKSDIKFDITDNFGKTLSLPCKMNKNSYGNGYVNLKITAKDGNTELYNKRVYIGLDIDSTDMLFRSDYYSTSHSGIKDFINSNRVLNANFYYRSSNNLTIHFKNDGQSGYSDDIIEKIVVGKFDSLNAAKDAEDVKAALTESGYAADYDSGVEFTMFLNSKAAATFNIDPQDEYVIHIKAVSSKRTSSSSTATAVETDFENEFFQLWGVKDENGKSLASIMIGSDKDTYYKSHYQTALVYSDSPVDMSKLMINRVSTDGVDVYDANKSYKINFEEPQDFTNGTINYLVAANGGQGYYPVTVKQNSTSGAELFVNGPSGNKEREVFFDGAYGMYHDIIIANIGNAAMTNLKVEISGAQNVKLDDYWRLDGGDCSTLGAFASASSTGNLAKIRLRPITNEDGSVKSGEVSGTLTVTADGQSPVTIKLIGHAGNPEIVTESPLPDAVKYVPYSAVVATDNIHSWNKVTFALSSGKLPEGVELDSRTGEIYGVPQETGKFSFWVSAKNSYVYFSQQSKKFEITVKENTDENVYNASDEGYKIKTSVGTAAGQFNFVLPEAEAANDQQFVSNGEYGDFIDFWLNGEKLEEGTDYTSESGSTVITIKSQTLGKLPKNASNTIAAEFRVNGNLKDDLKRTAQNFTIKLAGTTKPDPDNSDDTGNSGSSGGSGAVGSVTDPETSGGTSTPDTSDSTSTPSDKDVVFKPVHTDGELADIINGTTVTAPQGVMSKDAVLTIIADSSVPADKGTALDFTFTVNGKKVQPSGDMTVRIPIPDNLKNVSPLYVYHITDGKYELVNSWRDGDFMCFKASGFSTYIISGKKLDGNGNPVSTETTDTSKNPFTGIGISATGIILSAAVSAGILAFKKKKH